MHHNVWFSYHGPQKVLSNNGIVLYTLKITSRQPEAARRPKIHFGTARAIKEVQDAFEVV